MTAIASRGPLVSTTSSDYKPGMGLANCTFDGAAVDDVYDLVQFGSYHQKALNVVNCLFRSAADTGYEPFSFSVPSLVNLVSTSVKNNLLPPDDVTASGYQYDDVPLAALAVASGSVAPTLTPLASPPGLRVTADVASNAATVAYSPKFSFKPNGAEAWSPLNAALSGTGSAGGLICDANKVARPSGQFTRGAVQPLGGVAETGVTLTIRRNPLTSGTLNGPAVQAVEAGGALTAVTAVPNERLSIDGWYEEGVADPIGTAAAMPLSTLSEDKVLTVVFSVPDVSLTFDLGSYGHFVQEGNPTKVVVKARPGEAFPEIPEFVIDSKWYMLSWNPETPKLTPDEDTTYTAQCISSGVRIVYVTPEGAGQKDGTSWANAYKSVADAYADAGLYRGEVWMKEGFYKLSAPIDWKNNVTVRGGFAGDETEASEADPSEHPTVISGDVYANDYWYPNGADPAAADRVAIWQDGAFVPPSDLSVTFYRPWGNSSDDLDSAFTVASGEVTNSAFCGLAFTCFKTAALKVECTAGAIGVTNCSFLAVRTENNARGGAIYLTGAALDISNSSFVGCPGGLILCGSVSKPSRIAGCTFTRLSASSDGNVHYENTSAALTVTNCVFDSCYADQTKSSASAALHLGKNASCLFSDSLVTNCTVAGLSFGVIGTEGGSLTVRRSRFIGNWASSFDSRRNHFGMVFYHAGGAFSVSDSYFGENRVTLPSGTTTKDGSTASVCATIVDAGSDFAQFVNCTFNQNTCRCDSTCASLKTGVFGLNMGSLSLVNCIVSESQIGGESAEFAYSAYYGAQTLSLVNTVVDSSQAEGYSFYRSSSNLYLGVANSYVKTLDLSCFGSDRKYYIVNVGTSSPHLRTALRTAAGGTVPQLTLSSASPYHRAGANLWRAADGIIYFYDPLTNPNQPYQSTRYGNERNSSVAGITDATPLLADAFGQARTKGKVALGPILPDPPGLSILVR